MSCKTNHYAFLVTLLFVALFASCAAPASSPPTPTPVVARPTLAAPPTSSQPTKPSTTSETWSATSPDGEWLAEGVRESQFEPCEYRTRLTVTSADGAVSWKVWNGVQNCGLGSTDPVPFHWSQDGSYLYFTNVPRPDGCVQFVNGSDLHRVELATGQVTHLMPEAGLWLALSPDETRLAYIAYGGRGLVIRDLASGSEREIKLPEGAQAGHIVWSPDQRALLFTLDRGGCSGAYSIERIEIQTLVQTILIGSDERQFITSSWPEPERATLIDKDGTAWWVDVITGQLTLRSN
jgi:dipeptidyl aminopeptidase/acylaminoacyl peptidase